MFTSVQNHPSRHRRSDAPRDRGPIAVAGLDPAAAYYLFLGVLAVASAVIR